MDEVLDFCIRVLGPGTAAEQAAQEARRPDAGGRVELLSAAARACRSHVEDSREPNREPGQATTLASAVAHELASATSRLPERQREALALRDSLRISHAQIAVVMGIEAAAVAPLLARARLDLRAQRRGGSSEGPGCEERDRALRLLALRQDSEPLSDEDDAWLYRHLGTCADCRRAHAAMLEASACFRAWQLDGSAGQGGAGADAVAEPTAL